MAARSRPEHSGGMTQNTTENPPQHGTSFLDDLFARLRGSGYFRDTDNRWFGGVCSGLAQRFNVDPVLIRAAAVVLAFLGGLGITLYVVLWLLLPDRRGDVLAERAVRQGDAGPIALLVLAALLVIGGLFSIGRGDGWFAPLWLIPVAVVAWLVISRDRSPGSAAPSALPPSYTPVPPGTPPPPPSSGDVAMSTPTTSPAAAAAPTGSYGAPPAGPYAGPHQGQYGQAGSYGQTTAYGQTPYGAQPSGPYGGRPVPPAPPRPIAPPPPPQPRRRRPSAFVGLVSLGLALVGLGLGAALDDPLGFPGTSATLGFLIGLVGVSLVVLALGLTGRASGFSGFLTVVLAFLLIGSSAVSRVTTDIDGGVGDRTWMPTASSTVTAYELGAGDATLDLRQLDSATEPTMPQRITVEMGAGELRILVPDGLDTRVDSSVGLGGITHRGGIGGSTDVGGTDRSTSTIIGEQPVQVVVDAELGIGQITIEEL